MKAGNVVYDRDPSYEELFGWYWIDFKSAWEIQKEHHVPATRIYKLLSKFNIPARSPSDSQSLKMVKKQSKRQKGTYGDKLLSAEKKRLAYTYLVPLEELRCLY